MEDRIQLRMGGYGPNTSSHSRAMNKIGNALVDQFGDQIDPKYFWNIMDFDYRADDLLWMVEQGILTFCYFSTSYLTDRVPELNIIDLPFVFENDAQAHEALDGALGTRLTDAVENRTNFRVLGFWENGFRHLSNRVRAVNHLADLKDLKIRMQPNDIHMKTFKLLGAKPVSLDLKPGIEAIVSGQVDAQENPLVNTLTYGVADHHKFISLSAHFYGARGLFVHKNTFDELSGEMQKAFRIAARSAIEFQRECARREEIEIRKTLEDMGCEIIDLTPEARKEFIDAVAPIIEDSRNVLGTELFNLVPEA